MLSVTGKYLGFVSLACGVLYLVAQPWYPFPGSWAVKGLAVGALAALALLFPRDLRRDAPILAVALLLCAVGDVLLDLNPHGFFVYALGVFLAAHLIYTVLFVRDWPRPLTVVGGQVIAILVLAFGSCSLWLRLSPDVNRLGMGGPVSLYTVAITLMVASAILVGFRRPWLVAGAFLFLISDSVLAVNKFQTPVPYGGYVVWGAYYLAQYFITLGFLRKESWQRTGARAASTSTGGG